MRTFIIFFLGVCVSACSQPVLEVVQRVSASDGLLDGVICIRQTDATVPTPTEVFVLASGETPKGEPIWRADKVEGLVLTWIEKDTLEIAASEARIFLERVNVEVLSKPDTKASIGKTIQNGTHRRVITIRYNIRKRF